MYDRRVLLFSNIHVPAYLVSGFFSRFCFNLRQSGSKLLQIHLLYSSCSHAELFDGNQVLYKDGRSPSSELRSIPVQAIVWTVLLIVFMRKYVSCAEAGESNHLQHYGMSVAHVRTRARREQVTQSSSSDSMQLNHRRHRMWCHLAPYRK